MKKIISFLLVAVMITALCMVSASADTGPAGYIGDADCDGSIDVNDATFVMRAVAKIESPDEEQTLLGDTDKDGFLSVVDATNIQRHEANLYPCASVGYWYNYDLYVHDFYADYLSGSAVAGSPVTFTANVRAGSPIKNYELYVNGELVASSQTENSLSYTFPEAGVYDVEMLVNAFYRTAKLGYSDFGVAENSDENNELKFKSFYSSGKYWGDFVYGQEGMRFYAEGMGGKGPYRYEFTYERDQYPYLESPKVTIIQGYSEQNYFEIPKITEEDLYGENHYGSVGELECKITVRIKDADNNVVMKEEVFYIAEHRIG